jgi:hypothetical protein
LPVMVVDGDEDEMEEDGNPALQPNTYDEEL